MAFPGHEQVSRMVFRKKAALVITPTMAVPYWIVGVALLIFAFLVWLVVNFFSGPRE